MLLKLDGHKFQEGDFFHREDQNYSIQCSVEGSGQAGSDLISSPIVPGQLQPSPSLDVVCPELLN